MTILRFIYNNLIYYIRKNLLLALGVAISGAVLTGALVVGDSVQYSLNRIVEHRLGNITHVLKAGDRYFTRELALRMEEQLQIRTSSMLLQEGSAVADGGARRINHVQVLGIESSFDAMAGLEDYYSDLSGDSIIISQNLASRLSVQAGDELLLRIEKASLIPLNAPFVSDAESIVTLRATVKDVADEPELGRFNLKVSQTAPFNVFISLARLEALMDFSGRVNVLLFQAGGQAAVQEGAGGTATGEIWTALKEQFSVADAGLKLRELDELQLLEITSDRVFIDEALTGPLFEASAGGEGSPSPEGMQSPEGILTYFVNRIESASGSTPYSFVSTLPPAQLGPGEIIINEWLAEDLKAEAGDSLQLGYFLVGPLRELTDTSTGFVVHSVVPMEGRFGDASLMPDLPGLSDVGNCRDWNTGVPISLESIRDKDEDYWDEYRGIPKAFISVERAEQLWKNRFGNYTSFRYQMGDRSSLENSLLDKIDPAMLGFTLEDNRSKGYEAAGGGVDFSELFGGLSFFLLLAAVILTVLLFLLNLESRDEQLKILVVMGIPLKSIRRITLGESMLIALAGSLAGLLLSVLYNKLVFLAMNGVWSDMVRTEMMHMDIRITTLLSGLLLTLLIAFLAMWFPMNRRLKRHLLAHQKGQRALKSRSFMLSRRLIAWLYILSGASAIVLIASQLIRMEVVNVPVFFSAGGLLLLSAVLFFYWYLSRTLRDKKAVMDLQLLSMKNARRNLTRSMSIVILFAIGAFLVITTGSNRKDLFSNSEDAGSGTGGFLYYAESTAPVLRQLNHPDVRYEFGLNEGYSFVQLRRADGDDASCLNLNLIVNPRVLGVEPGQLDGRFSFVSRTPYLDEDHPWLSLEQELPGGLIPAIADETVIKWGLGLSVGDTLHYTNSNGKDMSLLLVGGLAPSIFQGNVLISNKHFLEQFPESSGTHVFLVEGAMSDTAMIYSELGRGMRDLGWDMELSAGRLAEFNSVTNTYLSIFMVLGALGLLVGTFGLVVVLWRSVMERSREIALLKAVGYGRKAIRSVVVMEYMFLLLMGIGTGFVTAIIATLPSIVNAHTGTSFSSILIWLAILVINGWFWIHLITRSALKNEQIYAALRNE